MNKKVEVKNLDAEWDYHEKISRLLDIPLKCPNCGEVLKTNKE